MVRSKRLAAVLLFSLTLSGIFFGLSMNAGAYTTSAVLNSGEFVSSYKQITTSTTGRYVAFISASPNLVSPDTNNQADAFVKDMDMGTISLVSITPSGNSGNARTDSVVIMSGNGRYVLFNSYATNLASTPGDYGSRNLYLRDLSTSTTYLLVAGASGAGINIYPIGMSEDGRFVYYNSYYGGARLYVLDRKLNITQRVDTSDSGVIGNGASQGSTLVQQKMVTCDGRFVVFSSGSTNLVDNDTNGMDDIFLADQLGGHTIKNITITANGGSYSPKITCDGNYILFWSNASNLVISDTNNAADLFRYKVSDGSVERVSLDNSGNQYSGVPNSANGGFLSGGFFDLSMDGRYIFYVYAKRTPGALIDANYLTMRDTKLGTSSAVASSGSNYYTWNPVVSFEGSKLFYISTDNKDGDMLPVLRMVTNYLP